MFRYAKNIGKKVADFYRTAPFGETLAAISVPYPVYLLINGGNDFEYTLGALLMPVALAAVFDARNMFRTKRRLKAAVEEKGFDARLLGPHMNDWYNRQVSRMIVEESGRIEDYNELYQRKKERGELLLSYITNF